MFLKYQNLRFRVIRLHDLEEANKVYLHSIEAGGIVGVTVNTSQGIAIGGIFVSAPQNLTYSYSLFSF